MNAEKQHIDPAGLLPGIFSGEASSEEKRIVSEWRSADPENEREYEAFSRLWKLTGTAGSAEDIDIDREWQRMDSSISPQKVWFRPGNFLKIAASLLILTLLTYTTIQFTGPEAVKAPATVFSEIQLPDGTSVFLNAGSKITYKKGFGITHRNLNLKGEAYFEVYKTEIPFIIHAGDASVQVTGTKFNVRAYSDKPGIKVTVTEGKVNFYESDNPHKITVVSAGETGIYDHVDRTVNKISTIDVNDLSWKTMILDFHNTPLPEVADILSSTYHVPVTVDKNLHQCTITVRFENQEADSVLNVLKATLDLTITKKGRRILITGKGC